jgi:hypothetical protein
LGVGAGQGSRDLHRQQAHRPGALVRGGQIDLDRRPDEIRRVQLGQRQESLVGSGLLGADPRGYQVEDRLRVYLAVGEQPVLIVVASAGMGRVTTQSGTSAVIASLSEAIGMLATSPPRWACANLRSGPFHRPGNRMRW